jgi:hypothetical protein
MSRYFVVNLNEMDEFAHSESVSFERHEKLLERHIGNHIIEGIDVDNDKKKVSFNPSHEEGVNTSVKDNPSEYKVAGINVPVWSIFKRVKTSDPQKRDGLPLLYAIKNYKGWSIDAKDLELIYSQAKKIIKKINQHFDVVITTPSSNPLNKTILHSVSNLLNVKDRIRTPIKKIKNFEVLDYINQNKSNIPAEDYKKITDIFYKEIYGDNPDNVEAMEEHTFEIKKIPPALRKYFNKLFDLNPMASESSKLAERIDGKDILIIDDTITSGTSISLYTKFILEKFKPKSVTVLTLFSPLENK